MMQGTGNAKAGDSEIKMRQTGERRSSLKAPDQVLKCPRCDSLNTKFCYYNNYSLTQPRHFCKTCRRYWTKGGVLRNVPIGGGCRKNKRGAKQVTGSGHQQKDDEALPSATTRLSLLHHSASLSPAQYPSPSPKFVDLIPTSALAARLLHHDYSLRALDASIPATGSCGMFGSTTTTSGCNSSILHNSCHTLANLPSLQTTLLGLHLPVSASMKPESNINEGNFNSLFQNPGVPKPALLNVDACASTFNLPRDQSLDYLNADLQWRVDQQQLQQRSGMVLGSDGRSTIEPLQLAPVTENENELMRYHLGKPKSSISRYPISLLQDNTCQLPTSVWQSVADGLLDAAGAEETGYPWNATAWSDSGQDYTSASGALAP
eukprot:Gb_09906 [translate_table: standard]